MYILATSTMGSILLYDTLTNFHIMILHFTLTSEVKCIENALDDSGNVLMGEIPVNQGFF